MSFRSTIGIYYGDEVAYAEYYRNVGLGRLLIEAFRLYERYKNCTSYQELYYKISLDYPGNMQSPIEDEKRIDLMKLNIDISEFPLLIDIKQHCIYHARYPKSMDVLLQYPDSRAMMSTLTRKQQYEFKENYLYRFTEGSVFWMDQLNVEEILKLAQDAEDFLKEYYWYLDPLGLF